MVAVFQDFEAVDLVVSLLFQDAHEISDEDFEFLQELKLPSAVFHQRASLFDRR